MGQDLQSKLGGLPNQGGIKFFKFQTLEIYLMYGIENETLESFRIETWQKKRVPGAGRLQP
jgi:hypothetical protein